MGMQKLRFSRKFTFKDSCAMNDAVLIIYMLLIAYIRSRFTDNILQLDVIFFKSSVQKHNMSLIYNQEFITRYI